MVARLIATGKLLGLGKMPLALVLGLSGIVGLGGAFAMTAAFNPQERFEGAEWVRHVLLDKFIPVQPGEGPSTSLHGQRPHLTGVFDEPLSAGRGLGGVAVHVQPLQHIQAPSLVGGPTVPGPVNGPVTTTPLPNFMDASRLAAFAPVGGHAPAVGIGPDGVPVSTSTTRTTITDTPPTQPPTPTPIPGAIWLLGSGLSALALPRLRRRTRA